MYDELDKLIEIIQNQFNIINKEWIKEPWYIPLNMKSHRVEDVYEDASLLFYVFNYRQFINDNISDIVSIIQNEKFKSIINTRVKALNSIFDKIQKYKFTHEDGKIALKKCLNDVYGVRIVFNDDLNFRAIKKHLESNYPNLKCIESARGEYYAIHIYFGNDDNYKFQWELQLWDKLHEETNLESHAKYKQDYTNWEKENI